jgi:chorismate mutase
MERGARIIPVNEWFKRLNNKTVMICGPCSAESEQQVLATASGIRSINKDIDIFRTGLWKPRTRPSKFQGVGSDGFGWLRKVKDKFDFLITVEVALPSHVEECLKNNIDILWIGARTVSNPFSVQEIVESLKGVDIPVMIKNPINPDISLWSGAIERFIKSGNNKVAAVHRGFYPFERASTRNIPKWEIPIELKSLFPEISVICDPSHIAGTRKYIQPIAQEALNLNMEGLMIETHFDPESALSDAKQQLTPNQLSVLIDNLVFRSQSTDSSEFITNLEALRNQIDSIDYQLIELIGERMKIVENIGRYKRDNNITILQIKRWTDILESRKELAAKIGISESFIKSILKLIHEESITIQKDIFNSHK